jgi:hypothetical protein
VWGTDRVAVTTGNADVSLTSVGTTVKTKTKKNLGIMEPWTIDTNMKKITARYG